MNSTRNRPGTPGYSTEIWVLLGASTIIALGFGIVAPVLPLFAQSLALTPVLASAVISVFALMRLCFAPLSGKLVQRFGERRIYLAGILIVAVATGACAFATSVWQLIVLRAFAGTGSTMFTIAAMGLLIQLSPPERRARVSSYNSASFLLGGIAGPLVGAALVMLGMRAAFLIYAASLLLAACAISVGIRPTPAIVPSGLGETPRESTGRSVPVLTLRQALRQARYRAALATAFANGWVSFGVRMAIVPIFVTTIVPNDPGAAGFALTAYAAGNAVIILAAGRWSDRYGRIVFLVAGAILAGVSTMLLGFCTNMPAVLLCTALAGVGSGLLSPSQQAIVADVVGQRVRAGSVLAAVQMISDAGAVIGPIAIGVVVAVYGYPAGFVCTGLVLLAAAAMSFAARRTPQ